MMMALLENNQQQVRRVCEQIKKKWCMGEWVSKHVKANFILTGTSITSELVDMKERIVLKHARPCLLS